MNSKLTVVVVEPATRDDCNTVKVGYVVAAIVSKDLPDPMELDLRSEQSSKEVTNESTNSMDGKDVQGVVAVNQVLELGCVIASNASDHSEDDSSPSGNVTRTRCDSDQSGHHTTAEADSRPLSLKAVVQETPSDTADGGCKVGDHSSHDSAHIGGKCTTSVESNPSKPQENGSNNDVSYVVRAEVELMSAMTLAMAQHERISECCRARGNVDRCSAGGIKTAEYVQPA